MNQTALQNRAVAVLLALVTIAFFWILLPYYGAIFWAVILGILFAPLQRNLLLRFNRRRNLAAGATLAPCLMIAILPVIIISALLVQEGATLYQRIEPSGSTSSTSRRGSPTSTTSRSPGCGAFRSIASSTSWSRRPAARWQASAGSAGRRPPHFRSACSHPTCRTGGS